MCVCVCVCVCVIQFTTQLHHGLGMCVSMKGVKESSDQPYFKAHLVHLSSSLTHDIYIYLSHWPLWSSSRYFISLLR